MALSEVINGLQDKKRDLETLNKEQAQQIDSLRHQLDLVKNEIMELRSTNKGLDTTKFS